MRALRMNADGLRMALLAALAASVTGCAEEDDNDPYRYRAGLKACVPMEDPAYDGLPYELCEGGFLHKTGGSVTCPSELPRPAPESNQFSTSRIAEGDECERDLARLGLHCPPARNVRTIHSRRTRLFVRLHDG